MPIKAIETRYAGHRFRSRLEARWAVFFESLGVQWEYEPEGFDLGGARYLPDFRVTTGQLVYWYEVKPRGTKSCDKFLKFYKAITDGDSDTAKEWGSGRLEARLVAGDPYEVFFGKDVCPRCGQHVKAERFHDEWGFLCYDCDMVTPCGGGNPTEIGFAGTTFYPHKGWVMAADAELRLLYSKLDIACKVARTARFEHGESPR